MVEREKQGGINLHDRRRREKVKTVPDETWATAV